MPPGWSNWARNVRCAAAAIERPASEEAVARAVRQAARARERLRPIGAGHSSSPLAAGDRLISLERCRRVLALDARARTVTVEGGIRLCELNEALSGAGLALANVPAICEPTIAGAISTATHGTGLRHGGLAEHVRALRLVAGDGSIVEIGERDGDLLAAARVGLGALGVITAVTLDCVQAFDVRLTETAGDLDGVIEALDDLLAADHAGFWWEPRSDRVHVRLGSRTVAASVRRRPPRAGRRRSAADRGYEAGLWAASHAPRLLGPVSRAAGIALLPRSRERADRGDLALSGVAGIRACASEHAIPLAAARRALTLLRELFATEPFEAQFPVDVRFGAADGAWLSPAHGRASCHIGLLSHRPFGRGLPHERLFREAGRLLGALGGRPHWGKVHDWSAADCRRAYPRWEDFRRVRAELDPRGTFLNDHLGGLLGAAGEKAVGRSAGGQARGRPGGGEAPGRPGGGEAVSDR